MTKAVNEHELVNFVSHKIPLSPILRRLSYDDYSNADNNYTTVRFLPFHKRRSSNGLSPPSDSVHINVFPPISIQGGLPTLSTEPGALPTKMLLPNVAST